MNSIREQVEKLIEYVTTGRIREAYLELYDENVTMQDNRMPVRVGRDANLRSQLERLEPVAEIHENRAASFAVDETTGHSAIEWVIEATMKDGSRFRLEEVAYQTWRDGKIIRERFYYDPGMMNESSLPQSETPND